MSTTVLKALGWIVLLVLVTLGMLSDSPIKQPDGVLNPNPPQQADLPERERSSIRQGPWRLSGLASYSVDARVLRTERYYFDDMADLSPVDVVFGWGKLSSNEALKNVSFDQRDRWYFVKNSDSAMKIDEVMRQTANTHLIPASESIEDVIFDLKAGHLVRAHGYLVEVDADSISPWSSSLSRQDTGDGSCEIFYVTSIEVRGAPVGEKRRILFEAEREDRFKDEPAPSDLPPRTIASAGAEAKDPAETAPGLPTSSPSRSTEGSSRLVAAERNESRLEALSVGGDVVGFLQGLTVNGLGPRGAVINGQFCRINETIDFSTGLRLVEVDSSSRVLYFRDDSGERYVHQVRRQ